MAATLGAAGVVLAFVSCLVGIATAAAGIAGRRPARLAGAHVYSWFVLGGALIATAAMQWALITRDFSLVYVAENGTTTTPLLFTIATMWAALEGSILLWGLVLAGFIAAVTVRFWDRRSDPLVGWALLVLFAVGLFFFGLMVGPANPFAQVAGPIPTEGPGPNPLLQNHPLMAIHPPLLYLGYVGFTVPFAFAVAALVTGRVGEGWLVETRRWTLAAWGFLTGGIVLGAWWSYEVLGWGGFWAWDPVENASFLPWLTGTAYLHSVVVQERRGMLRVWNLSLLAATFALTIFGTFLTRSGVLDSVHAFTESGIGPALLAFFGLIVIVSVGLIGWRGDRLRAPSRIDSPVSRESSFLANNVLFGGFAFVVMLGTVFPLVVEAVNADQIAVGRPFFDRMAIPIGLALLFLMAVAPALPWRSGQVETTGRRLLVPGWLAAIAIAVPVAFGARGLAPLAAFGLAGFAGGAAARHIAIAVRRNGLWGLVGRTNGGMIVHLGVVAVAVGLAASGSYAHSAELRLDPGESGTVAGHTVTYLGSRTEESERKTTLVADVAIDDDGIYRPALSNFPFATQAIGTPSVRTSLTEDVYLTLISPPDDDGTVVIGVIVQPMIIWLWIGGGIMALGTLAAAVPTRRRRLPPAPPEPDVAGATEPTQPAEVGS